MFNPLNASHFDGVFERIIRSTRNILDIRLEQHGSQLDDESLRTFMCEAVGIINARPLTVDTLNDPLLLEPLVPTHLLMAKSRVVLPPPESLSEKTCTQENDGNGCNTSWINFGRDGIASTFSICKPVPSGTNRNKTCALTTSCYPKTLIFHETNES